MQDHIGSPVVRTSGHIRVDIHGRIQSVQDDHSRFRLFRLPATTVLVFDWLRNTAVAYDSHNHPLATQRYANQRILVSILQSTALI